MDHDSTLGVLGAGNMACAIVEGAIRAQALAPSRVVACRRDLAALEAWTSSVGARAEPDVKALAAQSDWLLVGLKPQVILAVLRDIAPSLSRETLVVSLAAGIDMEALQGALPPGQPVIRLMPNTPCLIGRGATGLCRGAWATDRHGAVVSALLGSVGEVWDVSESQMDAVTAVSGSGPAYVFYLMEAMERSAIAAGLDPEIARPLVAQTLRGSAELAHASAEPLADLRRRVTSPGGTTEAAIEVLDAAEVQATIAGAIDAGIARGASLRGDTP